MNRVFLVAVAFVGCAAGAIWSGSRSVAEPISVGDLAKQPDAQKAAIDAAAARFKNRDYDGALKLLKEAVQKNPDLPPAHLVMAQWFSMANLPVGVRSALEQAVVESPDDPEAYVVMGDVAVQERRITEAILLYEKAGDLLAKWKGSENRRKEIAPRIPAGLAAAAEARGRWAESKKQLEAWLKLDPKSAPALRQLARSLFRQKDAEGALAKLKEAAKIAPDSLLPETMLSQYYMQSGDQENAGKWLVTALTASPKDLRTRLIAAQWSWENGRLEEADKQAAIAMQLDPASLDAKILRGIIALFRKDYKAAEIYCEAAHNQSPNNFVATNNLALALAEQKDDAKRQRALEYAENNARQYSKANDTRGPESISTYGWVLYRLGRHEEAEKWLRAALSNQGFSADTVYYLARVLVDHGQEADAQKLLESALATKGPFAFRAEARALLDSLKPSTPAKK